MRLLAITDIAFWQKISGTERLGEAKGEAAIPEGGRAERDDSRIKRIVFAVRYGARRGGNAENGRASGADAESEKHWLDGYRHNHGSSR